MYRVSYPLDTTRTSSLCCSRSISASILRTHRSLSTRLRVLNTIDLPGTPRRETCRYRLLLLLSLEFLSSSGVRKYDFRSPCQMTKHVVVSSSADVQPSVR